MRDYFRLDADVLDDSYMSVRLDPNTEEECELRQLPRFEPDWRQYGHIAFPNKIQILKFIRWN